MKIRLQFEKKGRTRFIGHLDMMRLFQRAIRQARIPIAYSQGFNPHPILSFALPLPVGTTSDGEYMDIEVTKRVDTKVAVNDLNEVLPQGLKMKTGYILRDKAPASMTLVDAAKYMVCIQKEKVGSGFEEKFKEFYLQEEILIEKLTKKKKIKVMNIKEYVHDLEVLDMGQDYYISLILAAGSRRNMKPELFLQPFLEVLDKDVSKHEFQIHRMELFALQDEQLISVGDKQWSEVSE